jgi:lysozyme
VTAPGVGIDVSHHQGQIDWRALATRDRPAWAVCKATEGVEWVDDHWPANRDGARRAGIPVGAYHFARPGRSDPAEAGRHHLRHATPSNGDLVPVLDLEDDGGLTARQVTLWACAWLHEVETATGSTPVVYTGPGFAAAHIEPNAYLAKHPLWVAHYTPAARPRLPEPWTDWLWWQFTDAGRMTGIAGNVDLNRRSTPTLPLHRPQEPDDMFTPHDAARLRRLEQELLGVTDDEDRTRADRMATVPDRLDAITDRLDRVVTRLDKLDAGRG